MTYFICYDIADSRRLGRVRKVLKNFGLPIQYSFFRCDVTLDKLTEIKKKLLEIIVPAEDSLQVYPLCQDCQKKITTLGTGSLENEEEVIFL